MTNLSWFLILIDILTNLGCAIGVTLVILGFTLVGVAVYSVTHFTDGTTSGYDIGKRTFKLMLKYLVLPMSVLALIGILIPSKKTLYMVMGIETVNYTIENIPDSVKSLGTNTIDLLNERIKKELENVTTNNSGHKD